MIAIWFRSISSLGSTVRTTIGWINQSIIEKIFFIFSWSEIILMISASVWSYSLWKTWFFATIDKVGYLILNPISPERGEKDNHAHGNRLKIWPRSQDRSLCFPDVQLFCHVKWTFCKWRWSEAHFKGHWRSWIGTKKSIPVLEFVNWCAVTFETFYEIPFILIEVGQENSFSEDKFMSICLCKLKPNNLVKVDDAQISGRAPKQ